MESTEGLSQLPDRLYQPITIMLKMTDYCPNNCMDGSYCFAGCNPDSTTWFDKERAQDIFEQAREEGVREVAFVSVEPFTEINYFARMVGISRRAGVQPRFLVTNGRFASSLENAINHYQQIQDEGFDFTVDNSYIGSGYNGIDVSVDQFHKVPPKYLANTILAALDVFGPTNHVSIRNTSPSDKYKDPGTLNATVKLLQDSGRVKGLNRESGEIVFRDGSRVKVTHLSIGKFGFAKSLPDDYFNWHRYSSRELECYKDLSELKPFPIPNPFHILYINPDGQTYPELGRFPVLGGGNIYDISVAQAIENIDNNPLVELIIAQGFGELMFLVQRFGAQIDLQATSDLHLHSRYLKQTELMKRIRDKVRSSGMERLIRETQIPVFNELRQLYFSGELRMSFS